MVDDDSILIIPRRGRPRQFNEPASERMLICLTPSQRSTLKQVAAENKKPVSQLIREAVDEYVGDYSERRVFLKR